MDHRSAWMLVIRSWRRHQSEGGKDTLTSSAETKYAIVCPSAMRVIQVVSNAACTHDRVQTELPANRSLSAASTLAARHAAPLLANLKRLKSRGISLPKESLRKRR